MEHGLKSGAEIADDKANSNVPQTPIHDEQLAERNAGQGGHFLEIEVEPRQTVFVGQFAQLIGHNGEGLDIEITMTDRDDRAVRDVLHLPGMSKDVKRHGSNSVCPEWSKPIYSQAGCPFQD